MVKPTRKKSASWGVDHASNWIFPALMEASKAYRQMAEIKNRMEGDVERNFLDPLARLQQTDLKEVNVSSCR